MNSTTTPGMVRVNGYSTVMERNFWLPNKLLYHTFISGFVKKIYTPINSNNSNSIIINIHNELSDQHIQTTFTNTNIHQIYIVIKLICVTSWYSIIWKTQEICLWRQCKQQTWVDATEMLLQHVGEHLQNRHQTV